jgi:hypothetical protein
MAKYLLTCGCGATMPVDMGQAGERIHCQCGATLEVPPLRRLRHQPLAPVPAAKSAAWSARRGFVAALLILATVLGIAALWSRITEPAVQEFDPIVRSSGVEEGLKTMTPLEAWQLWVEYYRPMGERGFSKFLNRDAPIIEQQIAERRFLQRTLLATAAAFIALAGIIALWPHKTGR